MDKIQNPGVREKFEAYPVDVRRKLMRVRKLILDVASESTEIGHVEETLKWGEPSFLVKGGSTVRIDWKPSRPDVYGVFFNCNTTLVDTFREMYSDTFDFDGNRAILFGRKNVAPEEELKHCVSLALRYHRIKHLPLLGA